jgi:hypothetical protein
MPFEIAGQHRSRTGREFRGSVLECGAAAQLRRFGGIGEGGVEVGFFMGAHLVAKAPQQRRTKSWRTFEPS